MLSQWQILRTRLYLFAMGVKRRMTLGVRVMLIDGNRVLLVRHGYLPGWYLPGGGVEPGETAESSASREVLEETGYRCEGRPELFGLYHNLNRATRRDHVALFVVRRFTMAHAFRPNFEIRAVEWHAADALPEDLEPGTRRRISEVFAGGESAVTW